MLNISRTRFQKDIVAEFAGPARGSGKVIILCDGLPTVPSKKSLMLFLAKKGYWVFHPRYRGTWESDGVFLQRSPEKDILDVINGIQKGKIVDVWNKKAYQLKPKRIYIIGSSFGGTAALLASKDDKVSRVVAFCPVVDWKKQGAADINSHYHLSRLAFGNAYRAPRKNWDKLKSGSFYNPVTQSHELDGRKIFIIHAKDDRVVSWRPVQKFSRLIGAPTFFVKKGGHFGLGAVTQPRFYRQIKKFLK